ncbi:hypothetical protein [Thauera aminoaromatica]|uniref:Pilus assembly protein PilV n=1 Tax=Thauera aminoaromatica TaxID=164330 RepID=A0A5C7S517_THASP|nr:hypothetical protein [Thauera aminoaromatica]MBL8435527.1 hypothetical protein [Zoogloea sp.]TXH78076.1 MAG: pilus assembly protein PilV [Thauera aminoaromatica]
MNAKHARSTRPAQSGYVLLEALVALLIFSLGLLGMIGFQAASTKIATDSRFRTEAAMLADELLAKMTASDVSKVETEFAYPNGPKFKAWLNDRVIAAARLPNAVVTPTFTKSATTSTLLVSLVVEWEMPGVAKDPKQIKEVKGRYVTRALLF